PILTLDPLFTVMTVYYVQWPLWPPVCRRLSKHWDTQGDVIVQVRSAHYRTNSLRLPKLSDWFLTKYEQVQEQKGRGEQDEDSDGEDDEDYGTESEAESESDEEMAGEGEEAEAESDDEVRADGRAAEKEQDPQEREEAALPKITLDDLAITEHDFVELLDFLDNPTSERMWSAAVDTLSAEPIPFALESISLARTCGISGILKRVFYELLRGPPSTISDAPDHQLSAADKRALCDAARWASQEWAKQAYFPGDRTKWCCDREVPQLYWQLVHQSGLFAKYHWDPMGELRALCAVPWETYLCDECVGHMRELWECAQREIWDKFDGMLNLA
ncbi:hypothetical protein H0H81_009435, partial [Sphagnurus paluster]